VLSVAKTRLPLASKLVCNASASNEARSCSPVPQKGRVPVQQPGHLAGVDLQTRAAAAGQVSKSPCRSRPRVARPRIARARRRQRPSSPRAAALGQPAEGGPSKCVESHGPRDREGVSSAYIGIIGKWVIPETTGVARIATHTDAREGRGQWGPPPLATVRERRGRDPWPSVSIASAWPGSGRPPSRLVGVWVGDASESSRQQQG
jgi:hypothetical protein